MTENNLKRTETQMTIRKPVEQVFNAFIDPEITKNFWFTKGSGVLEVNKPVTWEWEMYDISTTVIANEIIKDEKIVFEWSEPKLTVEFTFKTLKDGSTFVVAREYGYKVTGDQLLEAIKDSTGGFTTVLDGCKAYLEFNLNLNLIVDKFPKEIAVHGK